MVGVAAVTVKGAVADILLSVAAMAVVPAEMPVAWPPAFTLATVGLLDAQLAVVVIF
jgi:hypothetical protein